MTITIIAAIIFAILGFVLGFITYPKYVKWKYHCNMKKLEKLIEFERTRKII